MSAKNNDLLRVREMYEVIQETKARVMFYGLRESRERFSEARGVLPGFQ